MGIGFGAATASLAGFHFGSGDVEKDNHCATKDLIVAIIHGVIISILSSIIARPFLSLFTKDEQIIRDGLDYFCIVCVFAPCIAVFMVLEKILQCQGKMITTMIAMAVGAVTNIILDPLFILVFNMGVKVLP